MSATNADEHIGHEWPYFYTPVSQFAILKEKDKGDLIRKVGVEEASDIKAAEWCESGELGVKGEGCGIKVLCKSIE